MPNGKETPAPTQKTPLDFQGVLRQELLALRKATEKDLSDPIAAAHDAELSGLAFSGGGIRSATFNLGVLQALTRMGVLEKFDYLSTVSGGGYIGGWLAAWIWRRIDSRRAPAPPAARQTAPAAPSTANIMNQVLYRLSAGFAKIFKEDKTGLERVTGTRPELSKPPPAQTPDAAEAGFKEVIEQLRRSAGTPTPRAKGNAIHAQPQPIKHLRDFSNYLTPRKGMGSTDTWTLAAAYLRNFLLTFSILVGTLAGAVLVARAAAIFYGYLLNTPFTNTHEWIYALFVAGLAGAALCVAMDLHRCRVRARDREDKAACSLARTRLAVGLTVVAVWLGAAVLWRLREVFVQNYKQLPTLSAFAGVLTAVLCAGALGELIGRLRDGAAQDKRTGQYRIKQVGAAVVAAAILFPVVRGLCAWFQRWPAALPHFPAGPWLPVMAGPLLALALLALFAALFVGLASRELDELEREWLARLFAAAAKWTVLVSLLIVAVICAPIALDRLGTWARGYPKGIAGLLWAAISAAGAWLARAGQEAGTGLGRTLRKAVMTIAPPVFVVGLVAMLIATLEIWLAPLAPKHEAIWGCLGGGAVAFAVAFAWSCRVGVNTFSLHALYGNRLIRAYLGASNLERRAHPFTGFDPDDNKVRMHDLVPGGDSYQGPYPLVNAAVNIVHTTRLAWQQRKAGAFIFSPLFCGYEFVTDSGDDGRPHGTDRGGYVSSQFFADGPESIRGISLGKAMTISGAAASPNMGYRTTPALAFLMTVFNVRLGWWLPNTGVANHRLWQEQGPGHGLFYLLYELLGLTDTRRRYVYVTDGGHFENLGLYELVRRRCRHIVVCDAEEDGKMQFGGLGIAIERCRADFGISIEMDVTQLRKNPDTGLSRWHCAVGRIRYSQADPEGRDGTLIYLKASLTGDEPQDVDAYAAAHTGFPHESTADQWFDELQFESYRALGQHIANTVLAKPVEVVQRNSAEQSELSSPSTARRPLAQWEENTAFFRELFAELANQWYAHVEGVEKQVGDHDAVLSGLIETLRTDPLLAFLDWQLYPDLGRTTRKARMDHRPAPWVPISYDELRSGFFFCRRLLQFMQQVYHERELDVRPDAPSHRGWMNLLRRWSLSRMVRYTWSMSAGSYSKRFQTFCAHHLRLEVGELSWGEPMEVKVQPGAASFTLQPDARQLVAQPAEGTADDPWRRAERAFGLDFFETLLAREYLRLYCLTRKKRNNPIPPSFHIFPLRITTEDPTQIDRNAHADITVGFAVVQPEDTALERKATLLYLRMRPGMRKMGLARQALADLDSGQPPLPSKVAVRRLDAALTPDAQWHRRIFLELHPLKNQAGRRRDAARAINRKLRKVLCSTMKSQESTRTAEEGTMRT
jgi:hypothetical protein